MSNTDWNQQIRRGVDAIKAGETPGVAPGCQASDLKGLLHTIVDQISEADRRHSETLLQMQDRISGIGRDARSLRTRVPDQFASAFERIEAGMAELASRIADAGDNAVARAPYMEEALVHADPAPTPVLPAGPVRAPAHASHHAEPPMALRSASDLQGGSTRRRDQETARPASPVDTFDMIETSMPGNVSDPWDRDSAEALAGLYETGGSHLPGTHAGENQPVGARSYATAPSAAMAAVAPGPAIDHTWLEGRFDAIAKRIDESLADIRPDQGFFALGQRVDHIERSVTSMFEGVATRGDVEGIRLIEAHVSELAGHLDNTHQQLVRLDTIESYLAGIAEKLDDVHRAALSAENAPLNLASPGADIDVAAIAKAAAQEAAQRVADLQPRQQPSHGTDEFRGLLERFMSESRAGEENTTALLDTLQQAMIRLLDRVDAMELSHHQNFQQQAAPQEYVREQVRFNIDPQRPQSFAETEPATVLDAAVAAVASAKSMSSPFAHAPGDDDVSYDRELAAERNAPLGASPAQRSADKMRQDFIADARRAKMRLAEEASGDVVITKPDQASEPAPASKPQSPQTKAATKAGASKSAAMGSSTPRLMAVGLGALTLMGGLWYIMQDGPSAPAMPVAATSAPPKGVAGSKNANAASKEARSDILNGTLPAADGETKAPDQGAAAEGSLKQMNMQEGTHGEIIPGDVQSGTTSVPMLGIAVDTEKPVTAADLQRAKRQQAMANMSNRVGQAAADNANPMATPAALVPDGDGTDAASSAAGHTSINKNGMSSNSPLDLPPASVGPLSLRLAAANGDPSAEFEVGARLAEGKGTDQSFKDAAKWYQRSASKGFAQAEYRLGTLYERGLGMKADPARAESWYKRAAEQGNIKAMHNLAVMSANQSKGSPDYTVAAQWFSEAAERGLSDSQFNLAVLHENGLGVPQDLKQAYKWLAISARGGDKEAIRRRDILKGKLTADDVVAAEELVKNWKAKAADQQANDARSAGEAWKKNPANGING